MLFRSLVKANLAPVSRNFATESAAAKKVVLFPGHGIGPEITEGVIKIFDTLKVPIQWEEHIIHDKVVNAQGDLISEETLQAIKNYKYALKGPFTTPIGKGYRSINITLRKKLNLFANVRPCYTIPGIKGLLYENVNVVTIRENTEGEYSGLEHEVAPGIVENLKIISKPACENINRYAFDYAKRLGRKKVTCAHKAGVMVRGDGCFVNTFREISKQYPEIKSEEMQIDTICMRLVEDPSQIDVMVMPNLYGDIVSDLSAGLIGGLGLTASGNIGRDCEVYEAVHGSAPDIAGKDLANPTALLLSGCMMLDAMGHINYANQIRNATINVFKEGKYITRDLGGKSGTKDFVKAIVDKL